MCEGQSHVCHNLCVVARSASLFWCWDVLPTQGIVQKALGKRIGFGDDVVAQQPHHSCLVVHNTVCHVTPRIFPSSEPQMERCSSQEWLLCLWCQCFHVQSNCLGKHLPQCFHESAFKVQMIHCESDYLLFLELLHLFCECIYLPFWSETLD